MLYVLAQGDAKGRELMAEIVNLKAVKKAKARAGKEREAEANRAKFGRTKAERKADETQKARLERTLDGARLDE